MEKNGGHKISRGLQPLVVCPVDRIACYNYILEVQSAVQSVRRLRLQY